MNTRLEQLGEAGRQRLLAQLRARLANTALTHEGQLVAYLCTDADADVASEAVKVALAQALPAYMVPAQVVVIDALPRLPNGKLDRQALPALAALAAKAAADTATGANTLSPPQTDAEHAVARIWGEVLGMDEIGRHDNFFELGGHSLLVNQVVARIHDDFDVELPLRTLFDAPTLEACAGAVEAALIAELTAEETGAPGSVAP